MFYYLIGTIFILISFILLILAVLDIIKTHRNKKLIFLLVFSPILGPLIYFQSKTYSYESSRFSKSIKH